MKTKVNRLEDLLKDEILYPRDYANIAHNLGYTDKEMSVYLGVSRGKYARWRKGAGVAAMCGRERDLVDRCSMLIQEERIAKSKIDKQCSLYFRPFLDLVGSTRLRDHWRYKGASVLLVGANAFSTYVTKLLKIQGIYLMHMKDMKGMVKELKNNNTDTACSILQETIKRNKEFYDG